MAGQCRSTRTRRDERRGSRCCASPQYERICISIQQCSTHVQIKNHSHHHHSFTQNTPCSTVKTHLFYKSFFLFLFSQGGQLVGLMPVLAACHLIYVFSIVWHCIAIHVVANKVLSLSSIEQIAGLHQLPL